MRKIFSNGFIRKFENFRDNFIFANSVKRHICEVKKFSTGVWFACIRKRKSDLATSRVFYFHEASQNKTLAKISEYTVIQIWLIFTFDNGVVVLICFLKTMFILHGW